MNKILITIDRPIKKILNELLCENAFVGARQNIRFNEKSRIYLLSTSKRMIALSFSIQDVIYLLWPYDFMRFYKIQH